MTSTSNVNGEVNRKLITKVIEKAMAKNQLTLEREEQAEAMTEETVEK